MDMKALELDPEGLQALSLELTGKLGEVLAGSGSLSAQDQSHGWRRYQVLRYYCGSASFARLVKLQIVVGGTVRHTITPRGGDDELYLEGLVPDGQPLELRIVRAPGVEPAALPSPFPDVDVCLEIHG